MPSIFTIKKTSRYHGVKSNGRAMLHASKKLVILKNTNTKDAIDGSNFL